jgi:hypothetical protein
MLAFRRIPMGSPSHKAYFVYCVYEGLSVIVVIEVENFL